MQIHLNQSSQQQQQNGILVALDTGESNGYHDQSHSNSFPSIGKSTPNSLQSTKKFLLKNSDIIFENDVLQIGIKAEPMKNIIRLEFYYGNKTSFNLTNLSTNIDLSLELENGTKNEEFPC